MELQINEVMDMKVLMIDTGISGYYGGHIGYLEITPEGYFAGYRDGKLALPASDEERISYLEEVIRLHPDNPNLKTRLEKLKQPAPADAGAEQGEGEAEDAEPDAPICGTS